MSKKNNNVVLLILAVIALFVLAPGFTWLIVKGMWAILKIAIIVLAIIIILTFIFRRNKK